jgi:predicted Zn-dependent protease
MKKMALALAIVFSLAVLGGALTAKVFQNRAGGVAIWLPEDWEIDNDEEEGAVYADAPAGDAYCALQVLPETGSLAAALKIFADILSEEMDDVAVTQEARPGTLNGMKTMRVAGTGRRDEETWSVDVLLIASGKAVLMCSMGWEKDPRGEFAALRDKIFLSIQKLD